MRILTGFLFSFLYIIQLHAQSAVVLRLDSAVVETGEAFVLHIETNTAIPDTLDLSAWQSFFPAENILNQTDWSKQGNTWKKDLQLIVFEAAEALVLPPLTVLFRDGTQQTSDSLRLTIVATPVPSEEIADMADLKTIHREPKDWTDYIWLMWIVGGVTIALLVLYWISQRKKQASARFRTNELSAVELAVKKLDQLEAQELWQKGEIKAYYAALSAITRAYIDARYHLNTQKSGAKDAVDQIKGVTMDSIVQTALIQLLQNADLAKYAKGKPDPAYHPQAIQDARMIVNSI